MLKSVEWKLIRAEKFPLTPIVLFDSFTPSIESMISRHAAEINRRRQWLAHAEQPAVDEEEAQTQSMGVMSSTTDKYGVALHPTRMEFFGCNFLLAPFLPLLEQYLTDHRPKALSSQSDQKRKNKKNMRARWI